MNERIKTLWKQAGGHYNSGNQHTWPEYTIDDPEKFALLIVKECWTAISPFIEDDNLAEDALAEIKEHFGVEE